MESLCLLPTLNQVGPNNVRNSPARDLYAVLPGRLGRRPPAAAAPVGPPWMENILDQYNPHLENIYGRTRKERGGLYCNISHDYFVLKVPFNHVFGTEICSKIVNAV